MAWLFSNAWSNEFASWAIGEIARLLVYGLLLAATVWIVGFILFRFLEFLELSR